MQGDYAGGWDAGVAWTWSWPGEAEQSRAERSEARTDVGRIDGTAWTRGMDEWVTGEKRVNLVWT